MKTFGKKMYMAMLFWAIALLPLAGCADRMTSSEEMPDLSSISAFAGDLKDIELPVELEWKRDKSMTIKTESFNGGIWHYEGRVEPLSLKDYMVNAMHNNKWKLVGESTSQDIFLAFVKPNKTCMIVISDSRFGKTRLTLYVTIDRTAAAGLNPFGEAVGR
ncbi:MAG: hypothetical protein M8357_00380 [Desulfobulbaceae bacterium]|nr:hypothetical protein [Desulfobulbaceae bacterium]